MDSKKDLLEDLAVPEGSFIVIRCDGRGFSKLKQNAVKKPYDQDFHEKLMKITGKVMEDLFGRSGMAYIVSDEISFILPTDFNLFKRRVAKLLSLSSGCLSGEGSLEFYELSMDPIAFDSKIFEFKTIDEVIEYLDERKNFGFRNFVYTLLREHEMRDGKSSTQFAKELNGKSINFQLEKLMSRGVDVYKMTYWKREGEILYYEPYSRKIKTGPFGARVETEVVKKKLVRSKPLRFCSDDKEVLENIINSEFGGKDEKS